MSAVSKVADTATVSVVVPCFNGAMELDATLDALEAQTQPPLEIIVVDDGSTDNSAEIAQRRGGLVTLVRQANAGAAVARYTGIRASRGDIIVFNDAGDISTPERIAVLRSALLNHPHCVAATGLTRGLDSEPGTAAGGHSDHTEGYQELIPDPVEVCVGRYWPLCTAMNLAVWRSVAQEHGQVDRFFKVANDYALQSQIAMAGPFVAVHRILMTYSPTPGGLTARHGLFKQRAYAMIASQKLVQQAPTSEARVQAFRKRVDDEWIELWLRMHLLGQSELANRVARIGLVYGQLRRIPHRLWWALDRAEAENTMNAHPWIARAVRRMRMMLAR